MNNRAEIESIIIAVWLFVIQIHVILGQTTLWKLSDIRNPQQTSHISGCPYVVSNHQLDATSAAGSYVEGGNYTEQHDYISRISYVISIGNSNSRELYKAFHVEESGKDYITMTYYNETTISQIQVAAISGGTTNVEIQLPVLLEFTSPKCKVNYDGHNYTNGETMNVNLNTNETFEVLVNCDLTGTYIRSSEPISVFSGSYREEGGMVKDILIEQLMPTNTFGMYFILSSYKSQIYRNIVSIVTLQTNTTVKISGYDYVVIPHEGQQLRRYIESNENIYIMASKPITVMRYLFGNDGDAMILTFPIPSTSSTDVTLPLTHNYIKQAVPDSNFYSYECSDANNQYLLSYTTDITDEVYGNYIIGILPRYNGGTIFSAQFQNQSNSQTDQTMFPGDGKDNDNDGRVDEDICSQVSDGTDCGKLKYGANWDFKGTYFIIPLLLNSTVYTTEVHAHITPPAGNVEQHHSVVEITNTQEITIHLDIKQKVDDKLFNFRYLALPVDVLGLEYYASTECALNGSYLYMYACAIAAIYDTTSVEIGGRGTIKLESRYDSYFLYNNVTDLTGTFIRTNKPVSVACACIEGVDDVFNIRGVQLPPVNTWGQVFMFTFAEMDEIHNVIICPIASAGNTAITAELYETNQSTRIQNVDVTLNFAGNSECFESGKNLAPRIEAQKPILVTLSFVLDNNTLTSTFAPPIQQATGKFDLINGSSIDVFSLDINGNIFRRPFSVIDGFLYMASTFETINQPFPVTEQQPGDGIDNDGDGLIDEDYCLFLIGELRFIDFDLDGAYNEDCKGCSPGYQINMTTFECEACPIGFYRDGASKIDKCQPCPYNHTTLDPGTGSESFCTPICFEGEEYNNESKSCEKCRVGYYKNATSNDTAVDMDTRWFCRKCDGDLTTYEEGSESCIAICFEGEEYNNESKSCEKCRVGYYKNATSNDTAVDMDTRWFCRKCDGDLTTYEEGSESCIAHCGPGYELDVGDDTCKPCEIGYFKTASSESIALHTSLRWNCSKCPDGYTTLSENATACVAICFEGEEYNNESKSCEKCRVGYYKNATSNDTAVDMDTRWFCRKCDGDLTTYEEGSESCIAHCGPGYELDVGDDTCKPCEIGYFKTASSESIALHTSLRWNCSKCPDGYTTLSENATACVVECHPGSEFNFSQGICEKCDLGYYKPAAGNFEQCSSCAENFTTKALGQTKCVPVSCKCPCSKVHPVINYTSSELAKKIDEITKVLQVNTEELSSTIRKKISVKDDRPSSQAAGAMGIIIIAAVLILFLVFDILMIKQHLSVFFNNLRSICSR